MKYLFVLLSFIFFGIESSVSYSDSYSYSYYVNSSNYKKNYNNTEKPSKNDYIKLNTTNVLSLKGVINDKTVNKFLYDFHLKQNKNNLYVFIDSVGGSVEDGYKIITEFKKYNVSCIVDKAYSMAFAILQTCDKRYLLPHGKIMQHQISLGIMNELAKIENYLKFISQIESELLKIQSEKIGISGEELKNRSTNEWWLFGNNAIKENCADKIVNIECTNQLVKEKYTINDGMYDYIYSKCPLIPNYIEKISNNKNNKDYIYFLYDY